MSPQWQFYESQLPLTFHELHVRAAAAEHKQHIFLKRIHSKLMPNDSTKAVNAFTEIRPASGNIDLIKA